MKNKYILPVIAIFFIVAIIVYVRFLFYYSSICDGYSIGDWLINYHAGFCRRGLCGFLIIGLSDFLRIRPDFIVLWVQIIIYTSYMSILFILIYKKRINIWFLILLMSPATLAFPILDSAGVGRKEIILFLLFALYIVCLNSKILHHRFVIFLFSFALLIATLCHELVFFYTPYFVAAAYLKSKIDNGPFRFHNALLVIAGSFFAMLPLVIYGKHIDGSAICAGLLQKGLSDNVCIGVLSWPESYGVSDVLKCIAAHGYLLNYGAALLMGIAPFVLFVIFSKQTFIHLNKIFVAFLFLFLFSSPLFATAVDWGRFLNIHFVLLLYLFTLLLKNKASGSKSSFSEEYFEIPRLWKSEKSFPRLSSNMFFLLATLSYLTLWYMRHYGSFSIFSVKYYAKLIAIIKLLIGLTYA